MHTLYCIASLQQRHRLRVRKTHPVLEVERAFAIEVEALVLCLCNACLEWIQWAKSADCDHSGTMDEQRTVF